MLTYLIFAAATTRNINTTASCDVAASMAGANNAAIAYEEYVYEANLKWYSMMSKGGLSDEPVRRMLASRHGIRQPGVLYLYNALFAVAFGVTRSVLVGVSSAMYDGISCLLSRMRRSRAVCHCLLWSCPYFS